jgi:protein-tyrosine kinase
MSEIFDFLKKAAAERRKGSVVLSDEPLVEFQTPEIVEPSIEEYEAAEPFPTTKFEIRHAGKFDLTGASPQIQNVLDPLTLVGEQFRLLRSKLGLMHKQRGVKTILVTSSVPEEGKTFTASGLAGVFAQEPGKRVLLIDADMRKTKSGRNLGLNGTSSDRWLSEVLRGKQDFHSELLRSMNTEFFFLPSGSLPSNPSELLSTNKLEQTLKIATQSFDWVVVDSPPVLSLADTTLISPLCDAVILVVRANSTPAKLVLDTIARIGQDHICGVVLNRQKQLNTSRYYYQYYYRRSNPKKQ